MRIYKQTNKNVHNFKREAHPKKQSSLLIIAQVGNAGARVIELEGHTPGGVFGRPATGLGRVPWTVDQEATRVLAPDNPFRQAATDGVRAITVFCLLRS